MPAPCVLAWCSVIWEQEWIEKGSSLIPHHPWRNMAVCAEWSQVTRLRGVSLRSSSNFSYGPRGTTLDVHAGYRCPGQQFQHGPPLWPFFRFGNKLLLVGDIPNTNLKHKLLLEYLCSFPLLPHKKRATFVVHPKLLEADWTKQSFRNCLSAWAAREDNLFPDKLAHKSGNSLQIKNYIGTHSERCEHTTQSQCNLSDNRKK